MSMSQEDVQNEIAKAQQLQQQLQMVMSQKQQLEERSEDLGRALDEVKRLDDDTPVYQEIGEILVEVENKDEMIEELKEKKENADIRLKSLSSKEEKLQSQFQELQEKLSSQLGGM